MYYVERELEVEGQPAPVTIEVALQYVDDISPRIIAFANNIYTPGGGMHVTGFKTALTRTLNTYNKNNNVIKGGEPLTGDDVLEGLTAVISIKMPEVQFEGQTKDKLGSPEARGAVESIFGETFAEFLEEHPDDARVFYAKPSSLCVRAKPQKLQKTLSCAKAPSKDLPYLENLQIAKPVMHLNQKSLL
ncbi:MAG: hypothetical protein LRY41_01105 [Candidatus Pacebacteria bacterium]|nr:hypothetical protein [Candidatus Paceibacterota bacterium]